MSTTYPAENTSIFRGLIGERGVFVKDLSNLASGGTYPLTNDEAKYGVLHLTGQVSGAVAVLFPAVPGMHWVVRQDVTHTDTVAQVLLKTSAGSVGLVDGTVSEIWVDETGALVAISSNSTVAATSTGDPTSSGPGVTTAAGGVTTTSGLPTGSVQASAAEKKRLVMVLAAGFTPAATGGDSVELVLPYGDDAGYIVPKPLLWALKRITWRLASPSVSTAPKARIQHTHAGGAFSMAHEYVMDWAGFPDSYEWDVLTPFFNGVGPPYAEILFPSGDRFRFSVDTIGDAGPWMIMLEFTA